MRETEEKNQIRESIDEKPSEFDEKIWEENQKIIDIVNKKTFKRD